MRYTEIDYKINGQIHTEVVRERKGWEDNYYMNVLNRIESITDAVSASGKHPVIVRVTSHE